MHFAEIAVVPAILFSPKIKVATFKTAIYSTVRVHFWKFRWQYNVLCLRSVSIESLESNVAAISRICGRILNRLVSWITPYFGVHAPPEEYLPITRAWFAAELSQCLDKMSDVNSVVKQRRFIKNVVYAQISDLHWHWINWTLLCDTMEVSMLRLAWLPIAQHVLQAALTGRLKLISRKIYSCEWEQRLLRWADFVKNCLPWIGCQELPRKKSRSWVPHLQNSRNRWAKKWGPTCGRHISNSAIYKTAIYWEYTVPAMSIEMISCEASFVNQHSFMIELLC